MPATHAQGNCTRNLQEKFDASSSQFLAPKQLSGQSRCRVLVTFRTVSASLCAQLRARNLNQKKTCTRLTDTPASFWYKTTCTKFLKRVSPANNVNSIRLYADCRQGFSVAAAALVFKVIQGYR